ncbi:MAG: apolipoprotein N-acyltransferase [Candidatus Binatia bacterium]
MTTTLRAISVLASAVLYASSFPPAALSPLAWVALAPLLVTVSGLRPGRAAAWGALYGFVAALGVVLWLPATVAGYFGVSPLVGWASCLVLVVRYGALSGAVFAAWLGWATRRGPVGPLAVAAAWGAMEFARARLPFPVGNPWALAAYSQVGFARLMQIADVTGPYGVGMLIAAVNTCVAAVVRPVLRGRRPALQAAGVGLALVATLAYGTWRLGETFGTGRPITVAVVQGALAHEVRRGPDGGRQSVARHLALTRDAMAARPGLVVWPENVVDFHLQDAAPEREALLAAVRDLDVDLILGGPSYTSGETGPRLHNSVFLVRRGQLAGRYDKLRLLPVAEQPLTGGGYTPGRIGYGLRSGSGLVGAFVCFEAMYPELVRRLAVGTALLANLSNDGWLGAGAPAEHHLDIASVRAIENRRYLVRATTSGISAVIDPHGLVLVRSAFDTPEVLTAEVRRSQTYTLYQRLGDAAGWAAVVLVVVFSLWHWSATAKPISGGQTC